MNKILSRRTKKILGYVVSVLCLPLLVFSLVEYLFTAFPTVQFISRHYTRDVYLEKGNSFYIWYNLSESAIILNQTLHIIFTVASDRVVDFYVMSNSQFEEWENVSIAMGIMEMHAWLEE